MNITIWNEYRQERTKTDVGTVYPDGIHAHLAQVLEGSGITVRTATLDEPEHGLSTEVVQQTDVLVWWGHMAHGEVDENVAARVQNAVLGGMGLVCLHSAHMSKPFVRLMGTSCGLSWREVGGHERLWIVDPTHPIAAGLDRYFEIPRTEMYGEYFDIPQPDELVFISWFAGGEVCRSGAVWRRGKGKVFYFRPGHETYPIYRQTEVVQVIRNACAYVSTTHSGSVTGIGSAPNVRESPEDLWRKRRESHEREAASETRS